MIDFRGDNWMSRQFKSSLTESLDHCNGVVLNLLALVYRLSDADRQHVPPEEYREKWKNGNE